MKHWSGNPDNEGHGVDMECYEWTTRVKMSADDVVRRLNLILTGIQLCNAGNGVDGYVNTSLMLDGRRIIQVRLYNHTCVGEELCEQGHNGILHRACRKLTKAEEEQITKELEG